MSLLITFEGGEGSGKTTQIERLKQEFDRRGLDCVTTREPGGTVIGTKIRRILLSINNKQLNPIAELMLYAADRAQHIQEVLRPALKRGQIVLCDRFSDATLVYQGWGRKLDPQLVTQLNGWATGGLKPDLTFLLDISPEIGLSRAKARLQAENDSEGRFEFELLSFHQRVREGYLFLAKQEPERFCVIDATQDLETIHSQLMQILEPRLKK